MKHRIFHPFLFAVFPVLFLYAQNVGLNIGVGFVRPLLVLLAATAAIWFLLSWIYSSKEKAAVLLSLFLILFFSYGHINYVFSGHSRKLFEFAIQIGGISIGPSKLLAIVWSCLLLFATVYLFLRQKSLEGVTRFLTVIGSILVLLSVVQVAAYEIRSIGDKPTQSVFETAAANTTSVTPSVRPDIYYIILDGYARADTLRDLYGYDNADFLGNLEQQGFYIASSSRSNYTQTILSLASSLNFQHLPEVVTELGLDPGNRRPMMNLVAQNRVVDFLRAQGYEFVYFPSGYWGLDFKTADIVMRGGTGLSEFELLLLNTTPLPDILYGLRRLPDVGGIRLYDPWRTHRERMTYILDHLPEVAGSDAPRFVLAHLLAPHPPFVFGENGESIDQRAINSNRSFSYADGLNMAVGLDLEEYRNSYLAQVRFINRRLEEIVQQIIARSDEPPVIILQGDHGPSSLLDSNLSNPDDDNMRERMRILNAYYLPHQDHTSLYESITPVNSFRVIFKEYFGSDYDLLNDTSYFSSWDEPYDFVDVTEAVQ